MRLKKEETSYGMTATENLNRFFALFFLLFGIIFVLLAIELKAQEIMPFNQIKQGMSCYALTTLKGQTPEKIELKIAGDTMNPLFHEKRLILVEMQNGIPVAEGMSGSPVWCGKKLLGSISMRLGNFPLKKELAGITPIDYMRNQQETLGNKFSTRSWGMHGFRPIEIPIFISGASLAEIGQLNREIPSENFVFVSGGGEGQKPTQQHPGTVKPGDSITMFLSRGAVEIGGTCTVTEVFEKTFSACGHPLLGEGAIELPAYRSSVAATFQSMSNSLKIVGEILEPVGTIVYDNAFAVEGVRELRPNIMIPVNLSVVVDSDRYDYQFEVFKHKFYTPTLIEQGTRLLIKNLWADARVGTSKLAAKIFLKNRAKPIEIYDAALISRQRIQVGFLEGYADPWQILRKLQQTLGIIQQSEWNFAIERVELTLNIWSGNRTLMLDSMTVLDVNGKPTEEFHAGEKLTVIIGMRSEDLTQKRVRRFVVQIPSDLNLVKPEKEASISLPAALFIMSGTRYQEMDPKKLPKAQPDSAEEFLRVLRLNQRDPSEVFAILVLPPEYTEESQEIATLPQLKDDFWNPVDNLEFLRERKTASQPRVLYWSLGMPLENAIVSFVERWPLKLMLK